MSLARRNITQYPPLNKGKLALTPLQISQSPSCVIPCLEMSCCHDSMTASKKGQAVTPVS